MDIQLNITESAQTYLAGLLEKQGTDGMSVRMFVTQPGTKYAETCLAYCRPGEEKENDELVELSHIRVYLEKNSLPYLDEAEVDYATDRMGGQLTIKAPNAKMPKVNKDSPLDQQINYINPPSGKSNNNYEQPSTTNSNEGAAERNGEGNDR